MNAVTLTVIPDGMIVHNYLLIVTYICVTSSPLKMQILNFSPEDSLSAGISTHRIPGLVFHMAAIFHDREKPGHILRSLVLIIWLMF